MVIFNQTFTKDKPIYYPDNWYTGKTQMQLYEEWKLTLEYSIYSNLFQMIAGGICIFIYCLFLLGLRYFIRIYNLPEENRQRKQHMRYIRPSFLIPFGIITAIYTLFLLWSLSDAFTRSSLIKGAAFLGCIWIVRKTYIWVKNWRRQSKKLKEKEKLKNN